MQPLGEQVFYSVLAIGGILGATFALANLVKSGHVLMITAYLIVGYVCLRLLSPYMAIGVLIGVLKFHARRIERMIEEMQDDS